MIETYPANATTFGVRAEVTDKFSEMPLPQMKLALTS